jgi:hypothetical protein
MIPSADGLAWRSSNSSVWSVSTRTLLRASASGPADLDYYAVSVIGPRNRVDKLVKGLPMFN